MVGKVADFGPEYGTQFFWEFPWVSQQLFMNNFQDTDSVKMVTNSHMNDSYGDHSGMNVPKV